MLASCWSNPLSKIDLTITVTSIPKAFKNPAHSKAIYEAPTHKVRPGLFFSQKISSELMECYFPGMLASDGLPPVAIRIYLAVTFSLFPSLSVSSIVWASRSLAFLLKYAIFYWFIFFLYPQFKDLIWSVIF